MIYSPEKSWLWDCWIVPYEKKYYLFHLSIRPEHIGKSGWDGISLAISDDLVHFKEYGEVIAKRDDAIWMGTGMVQKIGDDFIMNFSEECPAGVQNIYFAKSKDLLHWERVEGTTCTPDGINYMNSPNDLSQGYPRWDSLGIVDALKDTKPPYYAFLTASAKKVKHMNKNGGLGLLTSDDGLNWRCLPNAFPDTDFFPQFEVPEHVEINGRHYVTFCTSSYLSHRFDPKSNDMSGGTFYVTADNLLGPYRLPDGDYMLQGTRNHRMVSVVTVGRPLEVDGQIYYYHIWSSCNNSGAVGTVKLLEEDKPYSLILKYNHVNDSLYGKTLLTTNGIKDYTWVKNVGVNPPIIIDTKEDDALSFRSLGTAGAIDAKELKGEYNVKYDDLRDGRIIDAEVSLNSGVLGFYFYDEAGARQCCAINKGRNRVEFGKVDAGWGPNMVIKDEIQKEFDIKEKINIKIIARHEFIEVYIDEKYASSYTTPQHINPNKFGIYAEETEGKLSKLVVREMK